MADNGFMLLARLVDAWKQMSATRSRNAKRDIIAGVLSEAADDRSSGAPPATRPDAAAGNAAAFTDLEIIVYYLSGTLRQRRTGIGQRTLADVPAPANQSRLTVQQVDAALAEIAELSGPGSAADRARCVARLFGAATDEEQDLLRGLIFGELHQGALEAAVQEGLAAAFTVPSAAVRRAAMLLGSTTATAALLQTAREQDKDPRTALQAVTLTVGAAVQPMLAASAPDIESAVDKAGLPAIVDAKLDGVRVQVHKSGETIKIFTRSLDEITARLPQVVDAVAALPSDDLVLDGEALALRPDGRPEVFQHIASRAATSEFDPQDAEQLPLQAYFFDLLRRDGQDLLDRPLRERDHALHGLLPQNMRIPRIVADDTCRARDLFDDVVSRGFEGVVIKNPAAPYAAGRRDSGWIKVKPRHTFDLVVTAAEWGHGRRRGWLSNLHLAARDPGSGELVMLGKTFKGLTDEMLAWQTGRFLDLEIRRTPGTVHIRPEVVAEIACDGLQTSPRYPGGVALRFARVLRYRQDKSAAQADSIDTVRKLLPRHGHDADGSD